MGTDEENIYGPVVGKGIIYPSVTSLYANNFPLIKMIIYLQSTTQILLIQFSPFKTSFIIFLANKLREALESFLLLVYIENLGEVPMR